MGTSAARRDRGGMPSSSHTHLAARAGRWSARHKKTAIAGWLAFVVAAVVLGGMAGFNERTTNDGVGESGRADQVLDKAFPQDDGRETVIVRHPILTSTDTAFRDTVADVVRRLRAESAAREVEVGQVSKDGHARLVTFRLHGDAEDTIAAVSQAGAAHPSFRVGEFGEDSLEVAQDDTMGKDFQRAEKLSIPLTLVILVVAFGSLVAAFVPLALALSGVAASLGLVQLATHVSAMDETVNSVVLLVGLAVGVDYSLFYLRREREERAAGRDGRAAIEAAAATSGHAVLVSGLTVVIAMAGMYLAGNAVFTSLATGSIIVVAVAMLASVSVLPALLSALGPRVEKGRVLRRRPAGDSRLWGAVLTRVLRRPALSLVASVGVLVALTIPAFGMHTALPGLPAMVRGTDVAGTYAALQKAFPGDANSATVVVQAADVTTRDVRAGIARLKPESVRVSADERVAAVRVPLAGDGTDAVSERALRHLREDVVPASGLQHAQVTGLTAGTTDFDDVMHSRAPIVFAFVLGLAFLLLLVTFRSLVIPIKAIALNLLSVGAAYGLLTIVFQHGRGEAITAWLPMFLFVILFGLSMDYHVFILSRIREGVLAGRRTEEAVAHGIRSTAGVVTSAAVVMVAAFAVFATLSSIEFQEMGVGLAAAVLIDATIVRAVALPAAMKLLGEWNWWLPGRGRRRRVAPGSPAWEHSGA
jgi:RND superfamily putative drug exporter